MPAPLPRSSGHGVSMPGPRRAPLSSEYATDSSSCPFGNTSATALPANSRWQLSTIGVEHRLRVGDRAADDAQDLGGRRLALERLLGLVEQARVLDRDHRLVGERLEQRVLALAQALDLLAEHGQRADAAAFPHQRRDDDRRAEVHLQRGLHGRLRRDALVAQVADLDQAPAADRLLGQRAGERSRERGADPRLDLGGPGLAETPAGRVRHAEHRHVHLAVLVDDAQREGLRREQAVAALDDLLEHRRGVGHRVADDVQHLGGRRLLLQRLLRLVEQAHVLDRDQRLVGERLGQRDLGVAERAGRLAPEHQHADALAFADHRHHQRRRHAARRVDAPFSCSGSVDGRPIGQVQHPAGREHARREVGGGVDRARRRD